MSSTRRRTKKLNTLKQTMLKCCNQVRVAMNALPLPALPCGSPGDPEDCGGHRALRDIGLGQFKVSSEDLLVSHQFAGHIADV